MITPFLGRLFVINYLVDLFAEVDLCTKFKVPTLASAKTGRALSLALFRAAVVRLQMKGRGIQLCTDSDYGRPME